LAGAGGGHGRPPPRPRAGGSGDRRCRWRIPAASGRRYAVRDSAPADRGARDHRARPNNHRKQHGASRQSGARFTPPEERKNYVTGK
jgi:hypothetical protein